jgi:large subunit ribosomal protein L4
VPRSYAHAVSSGEKKNALKAVLSRRVAEERLMVLDRMDLDSHRTKDLKAAVGVLGIEGKTLFVDSRPSENLALASRNVRDWKLVDSLAVNAYDVLAHGTVVLSRDALTAVVRTLGGE